MFKKAIFAAVCLAANSNAISAEYVIGAEDFPQSLEFMLDSDSFTDKESFFSRMQNFKVQREPEEMEEDDKVVMFGENFVVHTNADKKSSTTSNSPKVQGYQNLNCSLNASMAKICTGSIRDATAWVDFKQSLPRNDQIAYTAQLVAEATAQYALLFEFFGLIRSEIKFDLSLVKIRPLLFQVRRAYTAEMTWEEKQALDNVMCLGWYSEIRILPLYLQYITNIEKCAYSFIHFLVGQDEVGLRCYFSPSNRISSEEVLVWQGYRQTLTIVEFCS